MKKVKFVLLALISFLVLSANAVAAIDEYRLRQGDVVQVSVWGEASLQKDVKVLPDGSVSFPLAGRIVVAGLTSPEVEKLVADKLKSYFPEPQVTVVVIGTEGSRAYILGKVLKPGPIQIDGPMTVLQALSLAGGLDKFAEPNEVKVLRVDASGQRVLPVHYNKLLRGQELETNFWLQPGDTILVP